MSERAMRAIEKVRSGNYSHQQIEALRANALKLNDGKDVVTACDEVLALSPKPASRKGRTGRTVIVEERDGYGIAQTAYDEQGQLRQPELLAIAEQLTKYPHVEDVAILKTQIRLYYKGRRLASGCNKNSDLFWISILDETKITDSTIRLWEELGTLNYGKYFSTRYVTVEVSTVEKLKTAMEEITYT